LALMNDLSRVSRPEITMTHAPSIEVCIDCPSYQETGCLVRDVVKLSSYKPGEKGTIRQVCGDHDFRLRMMEMGFVKGAEIKLVKFAPLNDPMEFVVKGYHLTLRRNQAEDILMSRPEQAA
jgi:ferrous iron transport protein A